MINTYKYDNETWIDIDRGTGDEIREVMEKYNIHPLVARELTGVTRKPLIEFHNGYIFCILHFPAWKHTHGEEQNQEVDFIIGRDLLITARYDTIDALHKFGKSLQVKEILEKEHKDISSHTVFFGMLRELYSGLLDELEYIEDVTDDIESKIFKGRERDMVVSISEISRTLLDFKRVTDSHREILEVLRRQGETIFGKSFAGEIEIITLDYLKINTTIRADLEVLRELRDTNDSLLSTKQNEIMKQLTVLGAVVLPLSIITQLFGMSIHTFPLVDNPNAFWIILTMMFAVALCTLIYARHKKWI
jgi:magnesium transporter